MNIRQIDDFLLLYNKITKVKHFFLTLCSIRSVTQAAALVVVNPSAGLAGSRRLICGYSANEQQTNHNNFATGVLQNDNCYPLLFD